MRTRVLYTVCQQIPTKRAPLWNNHRSIRALFSSTVQATTTSPDNDYSSSSVVKIHSALDLGCIDYTKSWAWQHILLSRRLALRRFRNQQPQLQGAITQPQDNVEDSDCLLLLEHHPVYTLGRGADESHLTFLQPNCETSQAMRHPLSRKVRGPGTARLAMDRQSEEASTIIATPMNQAIHQLCQSVGAIPVLAPNEVPIFRVERGGEVTFHGPSQLVVYPLLDLTRPPYQKDLHWYLRMVEEVVIQTLQHYNIDSVRDDEHTGVWVGDHKVAAVGISSSRWITTHGFALNVNPDLSFFDTSIILPCGIEGKGVTSIAKVLTERGDKDQVPTIKEVASVVIQTMEQVFGVPLAEDEPLH